jgi:hypothetical protein
MERSTIFNGKIHYKWPFSIATLKASNNRHGRIQPWTDDSDDSDNKAATKQQETKRTVFCPIKFK